MKLSIAFRILPQSGRSVCVCVMCNVRTCSQAAAVQTSRKHIFRHFTRVHKTVVVSFVVIVWLATSRNRNYRSTTTTISPWQAQRKNLTTTTSSADAPRAIQPPTKKSIHKQCDNKPPSLPPRVVVVRLLERTYARIEVNMQIFMLLVSLLTHSTHTHFNTGRIRGSLNAVNWI